MDKVNCNFSQKRRKRLGGFLGDTEKFCRLASLEAGDGL